MAKKKDNIANDMIDIGIASIFTGIGSKMIQDSNVPFKDATSGLLGLALVSGTAKKVKKYL